MQQLWPPGTGSQSTRLHRKALSGRSVPSASVPDAGRLDRDDLPEDAGEEPKICSHPTEMVALRLQAGT